jgi:hypothetical protein
MKIHRIISVSIIIIMNILVLQTHYETVNSSSALGGFYTLVIYWITGFIINLSVFIYYGLRKLKWIDYALIGLATPISSSLLIYIQI